MAVPNDIPRIQHTANGTGTSFAYPAIIYFDSELTVIGFDPTTGTVTSYVLDTDYTIDPTELGQPTGVNVVFGSAPTNGLTITIARIVPFVQTLELIEGAAFPSITAERQLDELEFQIQQLQDQLTRVALLPIWTPVGQLIYPRSQDLLVLDKSVGTTPIITITPGNYKDFSAGVGYIPTMNGGSILSPQLLTIAASNKVVYAKCDIDDTTGFFQDAPQIIAADTMPDDTSTKAYDRISNINVTIGDIAIVQVLGGGVSSSRGYLYCGAVPAIDGSGHLFNS